MRRMLLSSICLMFVSFGPLFGQGMTVVGSGYANPTQIRVSPGQIIKLFVSGTKTVLPPQSRLQRATTLPLPKTLAGFSVTVRQGTNTYPVPLLSIEQTAICSDASTASDCFTTALTVQVPFEITVGQMATLPAPSLPADLIVNDNGMESKHFPISPSVDSTHVLTACDSAGPSLSSRSGNWVDVTNWVDATTFFNPACTPTVAHADGTLVSAASPAKPGETIVIYAYGLGQTTPAVKTGEATPTPAPVLFSNPNDPFFYRTVGLEFDFRVNAGPSRPYVSPLVMRPIGLPTPEFVGLTPGQVGLYQINVKLPDTFPLVAPCTVLSVITGNVVPLINVALSNLTISLVGASSFDGAAICVQTGQLEVQ